MDYVISMGNDLALGGGVRLMVCTGGISDWLAGYLECGVSVGTKQPAAMSNQEVMHKTHKDDGNRTDSNTTYFRHQEKRVHNV
jgi:hypothetical protein